MNDDEHLTIRSSLYRAAGTGAMYLGPGDVYRFLVTGADTACAYFAMEAIVAPGGGPPPHIHRREDETFYVVEVPRGTVHRFENQGTEAMRMILTLTPAGIEKFFEETLQRTLDPTADIPDDVDAIAARYAAAAPRYGMELLVDGDPRGEISRAAMSRRQPAHID
jgi:quercetin dioxygenase-like cupin family protein